MAEEDIEKTALGTEFGLFEYEVTPMGLKGAPASFQRTIVIVLKDDIGVRCYVYIDDIVVFTRSDDILDHVRDVQIVLGKLREANLKIKSSKCKFLQREIDFLEVRVGGEGIKPSEKKLAILEKYDRPQSIKQLQSFLGLASYYRKFIKNFADIASPLHLATAKGKKLAWNDECQKSFDTLRTCLLTTMKDESGILALPDFSLPFRLCCDASKYGIGAVLEQKINGVWRPIEYYSKHFNKTERYYNVSERELYAIVCAFVFFKIYLYGSTFTVVTDHQPLT